MQELIEYRKDEYIKLLAQKNIELENNLTETQLALCEIYEGYHNGNNLCKTY